MDDSNRGDVTQLLLAWKSGNNEALDQLIPIVYSELRGLARLQLRGERPNHSLQPTALTHEAFLRLFGTRHVGWQNRTHFFAVAAQLMRRVLVEHARKRRAAKRGASITRITLDEGAVRTKPMDVDTSLSTTRSRSSRRWTQDSLGLWSSSISEDWIQKRRPKCSAYPQPPSRGSGGWRRPGSGGPSAAPRA